MSIVIFMPRLDLTFKPGPAPKKRGEVPPIRAHWLRFAKTLALTLRGSAPDLRVVELPNWKITRSAAEKYAKNAERIYVPHQTRLQWGDDDDRIRFYMQTVVPTVFSVDPEGWGASATLYPIHPISGRAAHPAFDRLVARTKAGLTKFDVGEVAAFQPPAEEFVFFPCQIPHDESIVLHSDVSVADALALTLKWAESRGIPVVVKGHPMNRESMAPLKQIADTYPCHWVETVGIHDVLRHARMVVTVNSGVGFEALLHGKTVATFGRADYDVVSRKISLDTVSRDLTDAYETEPDTAVQKDFVETWYETNADTEDPTTFTKLI